MRQFQFYYTCPMIPFQAPAGKVISLPEEALKAEISPPAQDMLHTNHPDKGMTWAVDRNVPAPENITFVGCYGEPKHPEGRCNAYQGDTVCSTLLPVLCLDVDGRPRPKGLFVGPVHGAMPDAFYYGWTEARGALTEPVRGDQFKDLSQVNAYCQKSFGPTWRAAEFHDGVATVTPATETRREEKRYGGWSYYVAGHLPNTSRFWVHINDQSANCWGH